MNNAWAPGADESFRLQAADILFVHTKRNLWGWLIRWGTHCYWNHCLMVYAASDNGPGHGNELMIDAKSSGSIRMGRVSEYLCRPDKYDVAVKRMEEAWFQAQGHGAALDYRSRICNVAVNEVEFRLGSGFAERIDQIVRQTTLIARFVRRKLKRVSVPVNLPWSIRPVEVKAFTCGGFVQWCYYMGISQAAEERVADGVRASDAIFNPRARQQPNPFDLLTTTPADLANCDKLVWKYVIRDGVLQEGYGSDVNGLAAETA